MGRLGQEVVVDFIGSLSAGQDVTEQEELHHRIEKLAAQGIRFHVLGVGTEDEEFISIQSRDLNTNRVFKLTSVSNKPLEQGYLRIPREYKKVEPGEQAAANPSK